MKNISDKTHIRKVSLWCESQYVRLADFVVKTISDKTQIDKVSLWCEF